VRRVALTLRADAVEAVLDVLMPLLPQGVYERVIDPERTEVAFFGDGLPAAADLDAIAGDALLGRDEEEVPDSRAERRRRAGRAWMVAGRLRVRSPEDAPAADGALEVIIEPAPGAFGTGAHPTTRGCLELLLELEPGGGLADLGCGSGVVAIAAAQLGWEPVYGLDFDERAVRATERNAQRNGVAVRAVLADLREIPAPPAHTLVANIPLDIHERVAGSLSPATARVIVSGITGSQEPAATTAYGRAGLVLRGRRVGGGWAALWLERR
jgi:ribosomal protein L11 methyltransferase